MYTNARVTNALYIMCSTVYSMCTTAHVTDTLYCTVYSMYTNAHVTYTSYSIVQYTVCTLMAMLHTHFAL
jgi:hypothetical protein